ncbi:MAG: MBL fold metallo-hydrolase [Sandaracinaceae bacterium]
MNIAPPTHDSACVIPEPICAVLLLSIVITGCVPNNEHTVHRVGALSVDTIRLEYANAHLVRQGDAAFLVDSGSTADAPRLLAEIRAAGVEPATLRAVIVTHGHADHAGGAAALGSLGVPIVAGAGDRTALTRGWNEPLCPTSDAARERLDEDQAAEFDPVEVDHWVEDTALDLAALTGIEGQVVPLPGHTPGSLIVVAGPLALVGDLVRGEILSTGADVHFYMCDLEDNRADLEALLETHAPDAGRFFVGHFGPITRSHVEDLLREGW